MTKFLLNEFTKMRPRARVAEYWSTGFGRVASGSSERV